MISKTWHDRHVSTRYPAPTTPQVPGQSAGRRRELDAYFVNRQHSEDTRRSTSRTSQESSSRSDRHLSTARSRSVTANSPPYQAAAPIMSPTYPSSRRPPQMGEIFYLVKEPATDLYSPLPLMSPESIASTSSRSYTVRDRRSTQRTYRGS